MPLPGTGNGDAPAGATHAAAVVFIVYSNRLLEALGTISMLKSDVGSESGLGGLMVSPTPEFPAPA